MQSSENIKKNNLLDELVSVLNREDIMSVIGNDTSVHVLERARYKRMMEGFLNKDGKYRNLADNNIDYFLEVLQPIHEKNIKFIKKTEEFVSVVENVGGKVDKGKVNEHMVRSFNENYRDFTKSYPLFDPNDASTFEIHEGTPYREFVSMLHTIYEENVNREPFSFESYRKTLQEKLSSSDIMSRLEDIFADPQFTQIAWGVLSGKMEKYSDALKDKITDFVSKNPNDPKVEFILREEAFQNVSEMDTEEMETYVKDVESAINDGVDSEDVEYDENGDVIEK